MESALPEDDLRTALALIGFDPPNDLLGGAAAVFAELRGMAEMVRAVELQPEVEPADVFAIESLLRTA